MSYTIEEFWKPRFANVDRRFPAPGLPGWSAEGTSNALFVEADLGLRKGYDNLTAPIWFVAAPGAVGKSTLAKEISGRTGAVYLDLAKADTVAGNYLTGGLVRNGLLDAWREQRAAVLIDALDEARLRVTQRSFEDFLGDVAGLARDRTLPTVFFGRVGIVEEAWMTLYDSGFNCPIFDIDFFDPPRARRFVVAALDRLANRTGHEPLRNSLCAHRPVYESAVERFVSDLEQVAASDGKHFSGYAPVLEAVATVLSGVTNPARLDDTVNAAMQGRVLKHLTDRILEREAAKLRDQLSPAIPAGARERLYGPEEQLARLTGLIYGTNVELPSPDMPVEHVAAYDAAVRGFMPQHPFLDGTGRQPSGAVFSALLNASALLSKSPELKAAGERQAGNGPHAPNPFLIDFYLAAAQTPLGDDPTLVPEHVVALYESVRARASSRDIVRLSVEGDEEDTDADVEIQVSDIDGQAPVRRVQLRTSQAGSLRFGRQVNGVSVYAPRIDAIIGSGNPVELVAPVALNVDRLTFDCPELVVLRGDRGGVGEDGAVVLEARELTESRLANAPLVRNGAELSVSWPGANAHPWTRFEMAPDEHEITDLHDALRSLRRLVMAFRSHSKGRLARFKDKIEHGRMTRGELVPGITDD